MSCVSFSRPMTWSQSPTPETPRLWYWFLISLRGLRAALQRTCQVFVRLSFSLLELICTLSTSLSANSQYCPVNYTVFGASGTQNTKVCDLSVPRVDICTDPIKCNLNASLSFISAQKSRSTHVPESTCRETSTHTTDGLHWAPCSCQNHYNLHGLRWCCSQIRDYDWLMVTTVGQLSLTTERRFCEA